MARTTVDDATEKDTASIGGTGWKYLAKRVLTEFGRDAGTDQAAMLTYFMVLSIAPTLLALFSLATLLLSDMKDQIAQLLTEAITSSGIGQGAQGIDSAVSSTVESLMGSATGGTIALIIGIATALWSASAYVKAFARVSNVIYEVPEGRGPIRFNLGMLAVTAASIIGLLLIMVSLLLNRTLVDSVVGPLAQSVGATGVLDFLSGAFLQVWAWVKWPVILVIAILIVALLYWATPNIKRPFRLLSPGAVVAILGTILAAVALSIYMSTVAGYSSYGAIGGIMAVLFALWVLNIVLILGAEVDAEFERAKELAAGRPAEASLNLPLRGAHGAEKKEKKYEDVVDEGRDIRLENLHRDRDAYVSDDGRLTGAADRESGGSHPMRSRGPADPVE
ncbi:YihY/virulence factor BrkB family protein [Brachybacterium nesterenkovii]|uniref:Inner membrane protein YihY, formerly thought to be RNase BN n=1 Tax=Brachybacterium nesterenkovii TaxID=47847 RepID=A0A1X6WYB6_9MICO|nr:YihY/virulence factor BrkB family protein [Brachybacterium nesterenkovii]SLM90943.1 Inner membrane protein YihY, formerly thought to be RNase BN [Brachybacterium nesterenkovii]